MSRLKRAATVAAILLAAGCTGDAGSVLGPADRPLATISDAAHSGQVPGFYFLPPLVPQPTFSGTFDPALAPRVEICELAGAVCDSVIAVFTTTSGPGGEVVTLNAAGERYEVRWHTDLSNLDPAKHYRISVYVDSLELGFADVDVVNSGKEVKNVDTQEYIPLVDGRTLPIKFRIETGIVGQVVVSPDSATISVGQTQQFTATLLDLHGNPVTGPTVTWSSSSPSVATIDSNGLATGVSPGTVTITASVGYNSGTASLTVQQPNTPPVADADSFDAIGNVTIPVPAPGVLAGDTDTETPGSLTVVPGTVASANGGTVVLAADGSFTYLSAAGFTGTDSFDYIVTDGSLADTGTVTMNVPFGVWYVDNSGTAPGDGRDSSPFTALASAQTASAANETIFLLYGNGTSSGYDAGFVFQAGQSLTGQGVPADVTTVKNGQTIVLLDAGSPPTVTRVAEGATIQLATGNTVQGLNVNSTAGAGIAGSGFGTLTAGSVNVAATGGPSLDLQAGSVAATFATLSSAASSGAGLRLDGVSGTLTAPAGAITGAAGAGVDISGGDAVITFGGTIAGSLTRAASITGRTGGTLTLSGDITDAAGGILVQNNTGGTIAFNGASKVLATGANNAVTLAGNAGATISFGGGGLAIATTTGTGFSASGGGTVTVTGANNTVSATGGVAVSVQNTTIGASGLTFRSVSANGGSFGIVLDNTGALNGLQVTGDGSTAGSGGTIQNTATAGVSATSARSLALNFVNLTNANTVDGGGAGVCDAATNAGCNGAVKLSSVTGVSLNNVAISGSAEQGINGIGVTGLVLTNSTIQNAGNAANEHGIYIAGLFGTAAAGTANTISGTALTGSASRNVFIRNATATNAAPGQPDRLVISSSTISGAGTAGASDGVLVALSAGANFQTVVQSSTLSNNGIDCLQVDAATTARSDVSVTGSSFSGCNTAINLSGSGTSSTTFDVSANPLIQSVVGTAVNVASNGSAAMRGFVANNPNISTSSASNNGFGVDAVVDQTGSAVVDINGNTISGHSMGVRAGARNAGTGTVDLTLRNNTITSGGSFEFAGVYVFAGNGSAGESNRTCVNLSNNQVQTSSPFNSDYWLEQWTGNVFQLQGFAGDGTDEAVVEAFVSGTDQGGANVEAFGGDVVNFTSATCGTP